MMQPLTLALIALCYLLFLFVVAAVGDKRHHTQTAAGRVSIYPLSLAVYCTTWTFFGSVGLAATSGVDFLAIYIGPILMMTAGYPIVRKIVAISKRQRITSVADFMGARYGKSVSVAAVATVICVIGAIPYITLQLKAVSDSLSYLLASEGAQASGIPFFGPIFGDVGLVIVLSLAVFTILFGTRHADATEHQEGMILAVAVESAIKLAAFLAVGIFVTFFLFDGFEDIYVRSMENEKIQSIISGGIDVTNLVVLTFLSFSAFLMLPRQFHVAVVENHSERELKRARWLFPLYLVAINLFVLPIAAAGILTFGDTLNGDVFVLALPEAAGNRAVALFAFFGGISAGTAMVIVACVALAIMISNHLVLPLYLRGITLARSGYEPDMENQILKIRRIAITIILALSYSYYKVSDGTQALASIGLVSFAASAQLAPPIFGGLFWRGANAAGAILGMLTGFTIWFFALFLPTISDMEGISDFSGLGLTPLASGVLVSLLFNALALILGSTLRRSSPLEDHQATLFVLFGKNEESLTNTSNGFLTIDEIRSNLTRYLGQSRADRALTVYWGNKGHEADPRELASNDLIRFSENTLASAIGSSSSRLVHSLLLKRFEETSTDNLRLLDEATEAIEYNQNILRTAFDQLEQGITVFDRDMKLSFWNRQFRHLLDLPESVGRAGMPLQGIIETIRDRHRTSEQDNNFDDMEKRIQIHNQPWGLALEKAERILEIRSSPMPGGGLVIAWNDVTERVMVSEALREANESLEKRVEERTGDLVRANIQLERARKDAEQANQSKTRFLAAAGHDLMQPLNAARLYTSTLMESTAVPGTLGLADKIGMSLESVEEILGSVLAISRLDSASHKINVLNSPLQKLFDQVELEFRPIADEKNLEIRFIKTSMWVRSDPAYLRRILQNLVSNAIKYTSEGKILVGCRRRDGKALINVFDTGVGIGENEKKVVFREFQRLDAGSRLAPGLGLGLSIVERISKLLNHPISLSSTPGQGTHFTIEVNRGVAEKKRDDLTRKPVALPLNQLSGLSVICVDNDRNVLEGMSGLLAKWGCQLHTATDRKGALQIMKAALKSGKIPDIALVDYHLDNNDTGLGLIEDLRKNGGKSIPCVLVTADRSTELKKEAEDVGVTVLNKPVKPAALRAILSQHATRGSAAAAE